jgi:hypothetical protein
VVGGEIAEVGKCTVAKGGEIIATALGSMISGLKRIWGINEPWG